MDMNDTDQSTTTGNSKKLYSLILSHPVVKAIVTILAIVVPVVTATMYIAENFTSINTNIELLNRQIAGQNSYMERIEDNLRNEIEKVSEEFDLVSRDIGSLETRVAVIASKVFDYRPTTTFATAITDTYDGLDAPCTSGPTQLSAQSLVVYSNGRPEKKYTAAQVAEQPLLLPYTENGKEVFFYGQLDDSGNWDGHCIVNIYENDALHLITDAEYDGGALLSCKQAFPDTVANGQDVWVISERKIEENFSIGETWRYVRTGSYTKSFGLDDVDVRDILDADSFRAEVGVMLDGYYCGEIANGKYNDDTGAACFVKYFEDGTVRTLYVGKFKDGQFYDHTGNAWMIGKLSIGASYSFYKGPFENGRSMKDERYWEEPITIARVQEILEERDFKCNCDLKWLNAPV